MSLHFIIIIADLLHS